MSINTKQHPQEQILDILDYNGQTIEVIQWPDTIWCGKLGWADNNTDEPDFMKLIGDYGSIMHVPTNERLAPSWEAALFIDHHRNDRPCGTLFGHIVGTENQPDGYDTYIMPAQTFLRMRTEGDPGETSGLLIDRAAADCGYKYENTKPDFHYFGAYNRERGEHELTYAYVSVVKI